MRTFIAFTLPDEVANQIAEWQQANAPEGVFLEPATNLHMTLAFLGETPENLIGSINEILASLDPSTVTISGPIGYQEESKLALLTYNEQGGTAVWEQLNQALKPLTGYEPQFSPWLPHTTVWRFAPDHKPNINPPLPSITFSPVAVTLYQSVKNEDGKGATYQKVGNIFDPISTELDQRIFVDTTLKPSIVDFIERVYDRAFKYEFSLPYRDFCDLFLTGSLTTYQYSDTSDCDISVFPRYDKLEKIGLDTDTARKRLIAMSIDHLDGTWLPGGSHPLQFFVQNEDVKIKDLFQSGVRSGWDFQTHEWIVPPERDRVHNVEAEFADVYSRAAAIADKMTEMLDAQNYESARDLWKQVHRKRQIDQQAGGGDFSEGNIVYKYLVHTGIVDRLRNEVHLQIETKLAAEVYSPEWFAEIEQQYGEQAQQVIHRFDSLWPDSVEMNLDYEPAEQAEMVLNEGYEWKFAYAQGQPAKVWGDGEIYNFNDGRHPHTNVVYDDLNKSRVTSDWCAGWIKAPPLKNGNQPWRVDMRGGDTISDEEILKALGLEGQATVDRTGEARMGKTADFTFPNEWTSAIDPITMKVIYNFDDDRIILGTQADLQRYPHGTILGEYDGKETVTLHHSEKQWLNANYFRRLWAFSFPNRPIEHVYFQHGLESDQKMYLPTRPPRHVHMASNKLETLLEDFKGSFFEHVSGQVEIEEMRNPERAKGMCNYVAKEFVKAAQDRGFEAWLSEKGSTADEFGYTDRTIPGYDAHWWAIVKDNEIYGIDFTAAQYGYDEFPMIHRLEGEKWTR